jgi:hypothetical protein
LEISRAGASSLYPRGSLASRGSTAVPSIHRRRDRLQIDGDFLVALATGGKFRAGNRMAVIVADRDAAFSLVDEATRMGESVR